MENKILKAKGRTPKWLKELAYKKVKKNGFMAYHYACYDTNWSNPDIFSIRLINEIKRVIDKGE